MGNLARSCIRMFVLYAIGAAAVGLVVYHRLPDVTVAVWAGLIAGFFVFLAFGYLFAIPGHLRDWWRMRPGAAPRDGARVAVIGTINSGGSLRAPFSGKSCIAYQYKAVSLRGQQPATVLEGFAMTPSYVSIEGGQVRLLAYPELDVKEEPVRGAEAKPNAREFLDATSFVNFRQQGLKAASEELKTLLADDDGAMRYDHRMEEAFDLDDCRFTERLVCAGDTVCITGRYSEERQALVPDPDALVHAATIRKGSPASFRRATLRKAFGSVIGVVICSALVAGAALLFAVNVPMDAAEQKNPDRRFLWEEAKLEHWLEKNVRMPLVQSGTLSTSGMYFLELCDGCARGRLEANGRTIALEHAAGWEDEKARVIHISAAAGEADGVTIRFDRTRPVTAWHEYPSTITVTLNGRPWTVPHDWLLPADVQTSSSTGGVFDGRVTVMGPDDDVRVRAAFRAVVVER